MLFAMSDARVALITGEAKRVGRAIAFRLADGGFDIAFTYLQSKTEADGLIAELQSKGRRALAITADLGNPEESTKRISAGVLEEFGQLNVLVNNASIYSPSSLAETSSIQLRRLMAIHVESPLLLCQAFASTMRSSHGHIVNMLDLLAEKPAPKFLAYCASKAALLNLTLGLARELAPEVTVNGIAPGTIEWPQNYPEEEKQKYLKRVPLARSGTPQDAAALVYFLVTAGSYITGQVIHLDGGRSIT